MNHIIQIKPEIDDKAKIIKDIISSNENKGHISIRKITNEFLILLHKNLIRKKFPNQQFIK